MTSQDPELADPEQVDAVRRFNRFYTRRLGVLREGLLETGHSLAEVRVLYELSERGEATAAELCTALGLDAGYMSRLLGRLARQGLVTRRRAEGDGRAQRLGLSPAGRRAFAALDRRAAEQVAGWLAPLDGGARARLVAALRTIEAELEGLAGPPAPVVLRPPRPGDVGWVIERHGALYAREYGWDARFEALVAEIALGFLRDHDPRRERAWIAERDGVRVGSVFLMRDTDAVARLRLLLVEPAQRGAGIGRRLVAECVTTARALGYRRLVLWTNDVLDAARRLYQSFGFRLVREEPHAGYGAPLLGQHWELDLDAAGPGPAAGHWLLRYAVVPDYATRRVPLRAEHLAHAWQAHGRGELELAGALDAPADGAVFVFRGDSPAAAEAFARADPYVRAGLVTRWEVRPWRTVVGTGAATPLRPGAERAGASG